MLRRVILEVHPTFERGRQYAEDGATWPYNKRVRVLGVQNKRINTYLHVEGPHYTKKTVKVIDADNAPYIIIHRKRYYARHAIAHKLLTVEEETAIHTNHMAMIGYME